MQAVKRLRPNQRIDSEQSEVNHTADAPPCMHMIKRIVNSLKRHGVGDQLIQLNFSAHVLVYHSGQLRSAFDTAKCGAALNPPGN